MRATFNSVRLAQQAKDALFELGVLETHITLGELCGASGVEVPSDPGPVTSRPVSSTFPLDINTTLPSREFLSAQTADPSLSGALIGMGVEGYNSPDSEMQNADFNRNELDAGLYALTVDLEQSSVNPEEVKQVLERFGGQVKA